MPSFINTISPYNAVYLVSTGFTANVAAASTIHFDLFNASGSGKILRVMGIFIVPAQTAVVGIGLTWNVSRTNTVGTGSVQPHRRCDLNDAAPPAQITARSKPGGGAAVDSSLFDTVGSSEETTPYACLASIINHIPGSFFKNPDNPGIVLREGFGISVSQTLSSNIGTTDIKACYSLE